MSSFLSLCNQTAPGERAANSSLDPDAVKTLAVTFSVALPGMLRAVYAIEHFFVILIAFKAGRKVSLHAGFGFIKRLFEALVHGHCGLAVMALISGRNSCRHA